jgi:glycolate oxidase
MIAAPPVLPVLEQVNVFKSIVGDQYVLVDEEALHQYAHDETEDFHYLPDVIIKPRTADEISLI